MMERPLLANYGDKEVRKFSMLCKQLQRAELTLSIIEFEIEWENLLLYADMKKATHLSEEQSKRFDKARILLSKALNDASTDNEKALSIKALEASLSGVLPINNQVIDNLKNKVGLKEICV